MILVCQYVLIQGILRKDRNNHLKSFESIEHVTPLDPLDISLRLEELAKLGDGWLDGKGHAATKDQLNWLAGAFQLNLDTELPLPYLYPTAEGGVQAEWSLGDWEVSLDIDLESRQAAYQALRLTDKSCTEITLTLDKQEGWSQLNSELKQIENGRNEELPSGI